MMWPAVRRGELKGNCQNKAGKNTRRRKQAHTHKQIQLGAVDFFFKKYKENYEFYFQHGCCVERNYDTSKFLFTTSEYTVLTGSITHSINNCYHAKIKDNTQFLNLDTVTAKYQPHTFGKTLDQTISEENTHNTRAPLYSTHNSKLTDCVC